MDYIRAISLAIFGSEMGTDNTDTYPYTLQEHRAIVRGLSPKRAENIEPADDTGISIYSFPTSCKSTIPRQYADPVRVYRNQAELSRRYGRDAFLPTIIYFPGTAFVARETDYTAWICTIFAKVSGCQVIEIDHDLAPDVPLLTVANQLRVTMLGLLSSVGSSYYSIDVSRVILAAYSSGGAYALSVAAAVQQAGYRLAKVVLFSPVTDLSRSSSDYKAMEDKDDKVREPFTKWFLKQALLTSPEGTSKNPLVSPLWMSPGDVVSLPAVDIHVGQFDRFFGDSALFLDKTRAVGSSTCNLQVYPGRTHAYFWREKSLVVEAAQQIEQALVCLPSPGTDLVLSAFVLGLMTKLTQACQSRESSTNKRELKEAEVESGSILDDSEVTKAFSGRGECVPGASLFSGRRTGVPFPRAFMSSSSVAIRSASAPVLLQS